MKTFINIQYRKIAKWTVFTVISILLFVSCKDIYDNIKDFSVEEIIYPAKFDTIYGAAGFERVEIDLCRVGRVPASKMKLGKAMKTIIEYDSVSIVIDSVCSWVNIIGLKEPKLYSFKIYTANEYDDRSTPKEISLTPYTSQDRDALGLTPPLIIESTSSVLVEWRSRISSSLFNLYRYEYEYKDRDSIVHEGEGEGDLPSFFVENIRQGNTTLVKMKCRILPKLDDKPILDTIDWRPTIALNISNAAVPALFLKSPAAAATTIDIPMRFEWVMTDEVNDYTLKLSRNSAFLAGETFEINTGNSGEYDLDAVTGQELSDFFDANVMNLYWTVVPTTAVAGIRTQSRQLQMINRHPLAFADMLDIVFAADGTARDVALSTQRVRIERIKGSDPLDIIYNDEYKRYMVRLNPEAGTGRNPGTSQCSFYKVDYTTNTMFRGNLANTHSIEVVVMLDEDFPLPSGNTSEVKIFTSHGGGGTGIQLTNRSSSNVFSFQPYINGGWRGTPSGVIPERGRYYHIVGVWDKLAGKIYTYVDGELKGEMIQAGNFTFPTNSATHWFALGGQQGVSGSLPIITSTMKGDVVIVRIHSKALTAEDVAAIYQQLQL